MIHGAPVLSACFLDTNNLAVSDTAGRCLIWDLAGEGQPQKLRKIAFQQGAHPNVMIERVDLAQIIPYLGFLPLQVVDVDLHPKRIRILVGLEAHRPKRRLEDERDREDSQKQQNTRS